MADIFISYARPDRAKVERLAAALEGEGWSVWWDCNIQSGAEFSAEIERELHDAKAVIVCWSEEGAKSRWVRDEATLASRENKLKTISLDGAEPPIGYMQYHALDMSGWKGGAQESAFIELRDATAAHFAKLDSTGAAPKSERTVTSAATAPRSGKKLSAPIIAGGVGIAAIFVAVIIVLLRPGGNDDSVSAVANNKAALATVSENSIAVLPFVDLSQDGDQEYFSDGISEELLNVLAQISSLQVAGRTSSFAFKGDNRDLREIGELLSVAHILEGSVRKAGDKVRITAQLIKADNGFHLWSQTYDRELDDIFAVQDEIAGAILAEMRLHLPGADAFHETQRTDIEAYELFLKARERMTFVGGAAANEEAAALLDQAIAIDPKFAPALAWRAYAEGKLSAGWAGVGEKTLEEALPYIKDFADRALAADPQSADAHFAQAVYFLKRYYQEGENFRVQSDEALRKAIALRPNFSQAQSELAALLSELGQFEESIPLLEGILARDPGHLKANESYIYTVAGLGRFDDAYHALDRWVKIRPASVNEKLFRADIMLYEGRIADALNTLKGFESAEVEDNAYFIFLKGISSSQLGDVDGLRTLAAGDINDIQRTYITARADLLENKTDAVADAFANLPNVRSNPNAVITTFAKYSHIAGRNKEAVEAYDEIVKTPDAAIDAVDACGCAGIETLIAALRAEHHPDADKILSLWTEMAERKAELYAQSSAYHVLEASRHLLLGDNSAAAASYAKAMDVGWRDALFVKGIAHYQDVPTTDEFLALRGRMRNIIDGERKSLGLAPLPA